MSEIDLNTLLPEGTKFEPLFPSKADYEAFRDRFISANNPSARRLIGGEPPAFLPVIHVTSDDQAAEETKVAFDNGADGIFLIDHKRSANRLLDTYQRIRKEHPDKWIGINFLDLCSQKAIDKCPRDADGLWLDHIRDINHVPNLRRWRVFAGTAFKYQPQPENERELIEETLITACHFDVTTTSGPGTGEAADMEKLRVMKMACGLRPLAVASGVTVENVDAHLAFIDCFLVATGISKTFDRLDPEKVRALAEKIHNHKKS